MHPFLFTKFAMWINPRFEVKVIRFVYDEMIQYRNLAGDAYPRMCAAVCSILPRDVFKQKVRVLFSLCGCPEPQQVEGAFLLGAF